MLSKLFKSLNAKQNHGSDERQRRSATQDPLVSDPLLADLDMDGVAVLTRDQHCISRKNISPGALKVLYKLDSEGYQAFLVGGGVRDLLLGNRPKDFDIATDATPEQLRELFRNARIIGRRFKIVHIRFGREIIEATTFRAHHQPMEVTREKSRKALMNLDSAHSSSGMILRDNVYGDINEDALRRDFTVNALYYTIRNFLILDFSSGMDDIKQRRIRIIGDPTTRYKEDPVRMLRAIRFSAKLDFTIEENTREPINNLAEMLGSVAPARLFDETLKLLSNGHGVRTFELLTEFEVGKFLFPDTLTCMKRGDIPENKLVELALKNTDNRIAEGKSVTPAFLFAALLWPALRSRLDGSLAENQPSIQHLHQVADQIIGRQLHYTAIPRRFYLATKEIWELQLRLQRRNQRGVQTAYQHPRFRAGYDFLLLREESGEQLAGLGQWWTQFQLADTTVQANMIKALSSQQRSRRRPNRRRHRKVQ